MVNQECVCIPVDLFDKLWLLLSSVFAHTFTVTHFTEVVDPETEMLDVEVTFAPVLRGKRDIHLVFL